MSVRFTSLVSRQPDSSIQRNLDQVQSLTLNLGIVLDYRVLIDQIDQVGIDRGIVQDRRLTFLEEETVDDIGF